MREAAKDALRPGGRFAPRKTCWRTTGIQYPRDANGKGQGKEKRGGAFLFFARRGQGEEKTRSHRRFAAGYFLLRLHRRAANLIPRLSGELRNPGRLRTLRDFFGMWFFLHENGLIFPVHGTIIKHHRFVTSTPKPFRADT